MKSFFASNDKKITEKVFSQSLLVSVLSILLCLVALCSMTYAWFTGETSSNSNTLVSGSFGLKSITVVPSDADAASVDTLSPDENGVFACTLPTAGTYLVTLTPTANSTAKGHCAVKINGYVKNTEAIISSSTVNKDGYTENAPFSFKIETSTDNVKLEFQAFWSVVADPDIKANATDPYSADEWTETANASPEDAIS